MQCSLLEYLAFMGVGYVYFFLVFFTLDLHKFGLRFRFWTSFLFLVFAEPSDSYCWASIFVDWDSKLFQSWNIKWLIHLSLQDIIQNPYSLVMLLWMMHVLWSFLPYPQFLDDSVAITSGPNPRSSSQSLCKSSLISWTENSNSGISPRRSSELIEECLPNTDSGIIKTNYSRRGVPFIFQGLMLPLLGFRLAWSGALASWRCALYHIRYTQAQVYCIKSRIQKTLRGSSDEIGWLQHTPGMAPVENGTARFLELLEAIRNGEHTLPNSFVYLLVPGLFSNHGPLYFVATKRFFSKMGLACHIAKIHSEASVEHNAWELKQYIEELYWGSGKRVMLLGHSKGGVDSVAALSIYSSELEDKVAGLALVQSPFGGTPIASDILREGQIADKETRRIMELLVCKMIKGDMRALEDLTYEKRKEFIMKHKLPEAVPLISFHSGARVAPGVLATLTHIAHAELPWLPIPKFGSEEFDDVGRPGHQVPIVIPSSAVMAVCALHLLLRYGEKSDGLVACRDAEVPGSTVVIPEQKLDHAWMVYSSWKKNPNEPDSCEMCEALLTLLVELGKRKQEDREKFETSP